MAHKVDTLQLAVEPETQYEGPAGAVEINRSVNLQEWREGGPNTPWHLARPVACVPCDRFETSLFCVGEQTYQVRPRNQLTGELGEVETTTFTNIHPPDHTQQQTRDEVALLWPGTLTNLTDDDGTLYLNDTTGSYETPEIDLGEIRRWRIGSCVHGIGGDPSEQWKEPDGERWWTAEAFAVDDDGDPDQTPWDWDLYENIVPGYIGDPDNPTQTLLTEIAVRESTSDPIVFEEHSPGEYYGKYVTIRVTLTRTVSSDVPIDNVLNTDPIEISSMNHGLVTGDQVHIYGVQGTTAANGTHVVTVLDANSFTIPVAGNGAYTAGGTVVKGDWVGIESMATSTSAPSSGGGGGPSAPSDWLDISLAPYNCVADDNSAGVAAANTLAIQQALDDAAAQKRGRWGGVVYIPTGIWYVDNELRVGNWTRVIGANSRSAIIWARAASFPNGGRMFILGDPDPLSTEIVFGTRLEDFSVMCDSVPNSIGVYSNKCQEESGLFNFTVTNFGAYGAHFESGTNSTASIITINDCDFGTVVSGGVGIAMDGVAGQNTIANCTIQGDGGAAAFLTDGIRIAGTNVHLHGLHFETCIDGIDFSDSGVMDTIYGHPTVTNLIHVRSPFRGYVLRNIVANKTTNGNVLVDDNDGINYPVEDYGGFDLYVGHLFYHGPAQVRRRDQSGGVQAIYLPDTAGVDIELAHLAATDSFPTNRLVVGSGITATRVTSVSNAGFTMPDANNTHQYTVRGGDITGITTLDLPIPFGGSGADTILSQTNEVEVRKKTLVDVMIKREGQLPPLPMLGARDQTAAGGVAEIPDLAGFTRTFWMTGTPTVGNIAFEDLAGNIVTLQNEDPLGFDFAVKLHPPDALGQGATVHPGYLEAGSDADRQRWSGFNEFRELEVVNSGISAVQGLVMQQSAGADQGYANHTQADQGGVDWNVAWPSLTENVEPVLASELTGNVTIWGDLLVGARYELPSAALHVKKPRSQLVTLERSDTSAMKWAWEIDSTRRLQFRAQQFSTKSTAMQIANASYSTPMLQITGSAVGIDKNPAYKLDVAGPINIDAGNPYRLGGNKVIERVGTNVAYGPTDAGSTLSLLTSGVTAVSIDASQNVTFSGDVELAGTFYTNTIATKSGSLTLDPANGKVDLVDGTDSFRLELFDGVTSKIALDAGLPDSYILGNVGIGILTRLGTLHVETSPSGQALPEVTADDLIVEGNGNTGISLLSAAASSTKIVFGSANDAQGAYLEWNGTAQTFKVGTESANESLILMSGNGVTAVTFDSSQDADFSGNVNISAAPEAHLTATGSAQALVVSTDAGECWRLLGAERRMEMNCVLDMNLSNIENAFIVNPQVGTTWTHLNGSLGQMVHAHGLGFQVIRNILWGNPGGDRRVYFQPQTKTVAAGTHGIDVENDDVIFCNAAAGAITINLPVAATREPGRWLTFIHVADSGNLVTLVPNGVELIHGSATMKLGYLDGARLFNDGTNWWMA